MHTWMVGTLVGQHLRLPPLKLVLICRIIKSVTSRIPYLSNDTLPYGRNVAHIMFNIPIGQRYMQLPEYSNDNFICTHRNSPKIGPLQLLESVFLTTVFLQLNMSS